MGCRVLYQPPGRGLCASLPDVGHLVDDRTDFDAGEIRPFSPVIIRLPQFLRPPGIHSIDAADLLLGYARISFGVRQFNDPAALVLRASSP